MNNNARQPNANVPLRREKAGRAHLTWVQEGGQLIPISSEASQDFDARHAAPSVVSSRSAPSAVNHHVKHIPRKRFWSALSHRPQHHRRHRSGDCAQTGRDAIRKSPGLVRPAGRAAGAIDRHRADRDLAVQLRAHPQLSVVAADVLSGFCALAERMLQLVDTCQKSRAEALASTACSLQNQGDATVLQHQPILFTRWMLSRWKVRPALMLQKD
jgi:hypothetical protein